MVEKVRISTKIEIPNSHSIIIKLLKKRVSSSEFYEVKAYKKQGVNEIHRIPSEEHQYQMLSDAKDRFEMKVNKFLDKRFAEVKP